MGGGTVARRSSLGGARPHPYTICRRRRRVTGHTAADVDAFADWSVFGFLFSGVYYVLFTFPAEMDGREFDGARIVVQPGRGHRPNGPKYATRRTEHRITVEGLDSHTSWQDLKVCMCVVVCRINVRIKARLRGLFARQKHVFRIVYVGEIVFRTRGMVLSRIVGVVD